MLDRDNLYHSFWSAKGPIQANFWKRDDGTYLIQTTGAVASTEKEVTDAWFKFVEMIARGRKYHGEPLIEEMDYQTGPSVFSPYAKREFKRVTRASGIVSFEGTITKP